MKISKSMPRLSAIAGAAALSAITAVTLGAVPAAASSVERRCGPELLEDAQDRNGHPAHG